MGAERSEPPAVRSMREVVLKIRHNGQPECTASERYPDVTMQSVSSMTGRSNERKQIVELTGDSEEILGFVETFRECDPVVAADPITPVGTTSVFVAVTVTVPEWDSIAELLAERSVHYRTGTVITGGYERWTLYLAPGDDLGAIIDTIEGRGNDVELVRQVEMDDVDPSSQFDTAGILTDLTPRQREALAAAIRAGYYGHEKQAGVEDVADELGIGTTTAWEHLARAEGKVMTDLLDFLGGDDGAA